jgi:signal transduction histidine kinase
MPGLPAEFSTEIVGDPTALRRCFANLLRNSAQAARNGSRVRVEVEGRIEGSRARLVVRDNAGGIPADVLPNIFIPFFTTKAEGTGLGLALVHRIITDHGGTVSVVNEGPGAAFTLWFPLRNAAAKVGNQG